MWQAVALVAVLGLGASGAAGGAGEAGEPAPSTPSYVPRSAPQLPPLDASNDIFRAGFLQDPTSHFTFAARTDRLGSRPQVLVTDGNILAYINKRTRPVKNRVVDEPREAVSSTLMARGTPPPQRIFEEHLDQRSQHAMFSPELEHLRKSFASSIMKEKSGHTAEQSFNFGTTEQNHGRFQSKGIQPDLTLESQGSLIENKEVQTIRPMPVIQTVQPETPAQEEVAQTTAASPVVGRRMPVNRKKVHLKKLETMQLTVEEQQKSDPRSAAVPLPALPPPSPVVPSSTPRYRGTPPPQYTFEEEQNQSESFPRRIIEDDSEQAIAASTDTLEHPSIIGTSEHNLGRFQPKWIRSDLVLESQNSLVENEEIHAGRSRPVKPTVQPTDPAEEENTQETAASPLIEGRKPVERRTMRRKENERTEQRAPGRESGAPRAAASRHPALPPPPPVPTLSPWIDGYGK